MCILFFERDDFLNKLIKKTMIFGAALSLFTPTIALAAPSDPPSGTPPSGNSSGMQKPPGNGSSQNGSSSNVSYKGSTKITKDTTESDKTYTSKSGGQAAILASKGTSTLNNVTVNKTGSESGGDDADFYGTNAAVLAYNGATLNIKGGTITTNAEHANAVFAYGKGVINIGDVTINTSGNTSGGIMVTGGGTLTADNLTVKTKGNSSAAIRSDRGGGTLTVNGGTYETSGMGSPAIYSTADITVNDATLTSTSSEGAVVEGANSITLNNTTLTDTNTTLNGNSETYKNIFLYQSMSGDADKGTASFTAKDSTITTNKGDTIFVTNTTATINLENNTISNTDGDFLRIQTGKWGNSGSNGGNVTLKMTNQEVEGNIIVDSISTLDLSLENGSVLKGAIDSKNEAKKVNLSLSSDSVMVLSEDTYVDTLENELSDNSNIYLNGHKLYVNGKEVSANEGTYKEKNNSDDSNKENNNSNDYYLYYAGIGIVTLVIISGIVVLVVKSKKKNNY